jgi:hypothetical protein
MEIPGGPLTYKSQHEPVPLSDLELALLVAAATGVTGWNFGIPFTINESDRLSDYSLRLTGRTIPSAATICTTELFIPMTLAFISLALVTSHRNAFASLSKTMILRVLLTFLRLLQSS